MTWREWYGPGGPAELLVGVAFGAERAAGNRVSAHPATGGEDWAGAIAPHRSSLSHAPTQNAPAPHDMHVFGAQEPRMRCEAGRGSSRLDNRVARRAVSR